VTAKELTRIITRLGGRLIRQSKGSHQLWGTDHCHASIPFHKGQDLGRGLLRRLERDLEHCFGKGWIDKNK
jgi:predicted RNA binding protein YcfA (HicA-like mRNA interferase family)